MTELTKDGGEHELIIVRRRADPDAFTAKGGVWKIAHADFMTAMMAFFLVMWLISTTDDTAKREIAQYFNPVKLAEMSPYQKGVGDPQPKGGSSASDADSQGSKEGTAYRAQNLTSEVQQYGEAGNRTYVEGSRSSETLPTYTEAEIFSDPYGVLNHIMQAAKASGELSEEETGSNDQIGNKGGAALRDPFDPLYWQMEPDQPSSEMVADMTQSPLEPLLGDPEALNGLITGPDPASQISSGPASGSRVASATEGLETMPLLSDGTQDPTAKTPVSQDTLTGFELVEQTRLSDTGETPAPMIAAKGNGSETAPVQTQAKSEPGESPDKGIAVAKATAESADAAPASAASSARMEQFQAALATELNRAPKIEINGQLNVRDKGDGLLIDVTDSPTWGMFAVGSSEPSARSIALLEKIARSLNSVKGKIIIRGHTDGRPFHSKDYDNWRLSTARAHMARFMLVRGGLDESRLLRVEGYADHELKHPDRPDADDNRRIEILVQPTSGAEE